MGIEQVQQQNIGYHDGNENGQKVRHGKKLGVENAFPGHLHHSAGKRHAGKNTKACNNHDDFKGCRFGTDGRVQKIDRIIGYPHHKVKDGKQDKDTDNDIAYLKTHEVLSNFF